MAHKVKYSHEIDDGDSKNLEALNDIKRMLKGNKKLSEIQFVIIHFNEYCQLNLDGKPVTRSDLYLPAEVALVAFSVSSGRIDSYTSLIDPGQAPFGTAAAVKETCRRIAVPLPGFDPNCQKWDNILSKIENFLQTYAVQDNKITMFCLRKDIDMTRGCLKWMYQNVTAKDSGVLESFVLKPLELLIFLMTDKGHACRQALSTGLIKSSVEVREMIDGLVKIFGLGNFPQIVSPLHAQIAAEQGKPVAEEFLLRFGKFFNELHAEEFLLTAGNYNVNFGCDHHKKKENADVGLQHCSCFLAKQFAASISDSLGKLMKYD